MYMKKHFTTIYIVRHGQSEANAKNDIIHQIDLNRWGELESPLTALGTEQAQRTADNLREVQFDAFFSSDLQRAKETADIIARPHNKPVITITTIREMKYGDYYEKLPPEKKIEVKKALYALSDEEKYLFKYSPDGETILEAVNRFISFIKEITPAYKGKTVLVVNHGAIMRSFLVHIGWANFSELPGSSISNAAYYVVESNGEEFYIKETYGINKTVT